MNNKYSYIILKDNINYDDVKFNEYDVYRSFYDCLYKINDNFIFDKEITYYEHFCELCSLIISEDVEYCTNGNKHVCIVCCYNKWKKYNKYIDYRIFKSDKIYMIIRVNMNVNLNLDLNIVYDELYNYYFNIIRYKYLDQFNKNCRLIKYRIQKIKNKTINYNCTQCLINYYKNLFYEDNNEITDNDLKNY